MQELERLHKASVQLGSAFGEFFSAVADYLGKTLKNISPTLKEIGSVGAAYNTARAEHPEWVHRANYSKKRRIQKKYHDRIMREYGGVNNG